ncbi:MAG: CHC2 zinc finger domain-containing protein [Candidatus Helarchaeota archaeon]
MKKNNILTLGIIRDYILKYFPETLWWDGYGKHEIFNKNKSYKHRQGLPNEIRIEFDNKNINKNLEAINYVLIKLEELKYSFAVYYTEGGRGPHIHIYDLDELEELDYEQRTEYRKRFLKKICGKYKPDFALCDEKHLCALEFANHFKYNKPKQLLSYFDNGTNMGIDIKIKLDILFNKIKKYKPTNKETRLKFGDMLKSKKRDLIINNCSFEKVFEKYGIEYKGTMALCPFHADSNKSLSFSNKKGLWKCFGCNAKGDIITLIKMLMEISNDNTK